MPHRSRSAIKRIEMTLPGLCELAQGGTAVGTGLNAPSRLCRKGRGRDRQDHRHCRSSPRRTSSRRLPRTIRMVFSHGAINAAAAALFKIANDIRLLGSGPRSGLGELYAAGKRAGLVDHAGQGQPDPVRGADAGLRPGVRQPRRAHLRRQPGPFRAQRLSTR